MIAKGRKFSLPIDLQLELFDAMVLLIITYGCEIWGYKVLKVIEIVHLTFLKHDLGVSIDRSLRFEYHIATVARQTSLRVSALRRMADTLNPQGILTLYKAQQIRPCMDYGALSWMSSAATHMQRLDAVQQRALRLVATDEDQQQPATVTSLKHSRDVSALVVCHKAQVQGDSHLDPLKLLPRTVQRCTRGVANNDECVEVPHSRTSQHQCTYASRTSRLWNLFTVATPGVRDLNTQNFTLAAHR